MSSNVQTIIEKAVKTEAKELNLSGQDLTRIPNEVFKLEKLEHLKLMHNQISEIPAEIVKLRQLKTLYISFNRIREIREDILINMPYLDCLDIAENPIDYVKVSKFYYENNPNFGLQKALKEIEMAIINNLDSFSLSENLGIIPEELFELENLEVLRINCKSITKIPKEIGKLKNLKVLNLSSNQLTELPEEICQLTSLEELNLNYNLFESIPFSVYKLPKLKDFNICDNKIKKMDLEIFNLDLEYFYAYNNPLENFEEDLFNYDYNTLKTRFGKKAN